MFYDQLKKISNLDAILGIYWVGEKMKSIDIVDTFVMRGETARL